MSALEFLTHGGMASVGGDLPAPEQERASQVAKAFGEAVREQARHLGIPAAANAVFRATFLLAAKDIASIHFVFADKPGGNQISYRDLSSHGQIPLAALVNQVRMEVGEAAWAFSVPAGVLSTGTDHSAATNTAALQYCQFVVQQMKTTAPTSQVQQEAVATPDLAPFISKFRKDYPKGTKTAFVMMSFATTDAHKKIFETVQTALSAHAIKALRADSKEYSDDTFANIRTYMHCCDFGIAIFERILQDDFNPNVSLETGYMLGLGKPVCLLKDGTLKSLPSDLIGKLYKKYDPQRITDTIGPELLKWTKDRSLL